MKGAITAIIIGTLAGVLIYTLNIFGIRTFTDNLMATITNQISQQPSAVITGAGVSAVSLGGAAYKIIGGIKKKAQETINTVSQTASAQVNTANEQTVQIASEKTALENKIKELESTIPDTTALQQTITQKDEAIKKAQNQIDALHELIPSIKNKVVEVTTVK